ncbi:PREDICTED: uncharacterized protein LOC109584918 [Amphimedon queenslandica]|uniref:Death domain-containing protein n=1 Tax=Amphimedon queenslandica TaxID=400682 RepID=A0A1X7U2S9_AMPQE|nr:PREDICTED: uncharacterized protein LOC109584918 [Amphimedon queenslandica]|eukprot:XP_019856392.1 PREDICTED: uncharacterized protein LOC109584918 [Amphimedon queenslandica]
MAERISPSPTLPLSPQLARAVMNGKPDLKIVCAIVRTSRWHQLGIQLGVDEEMLQDIETDRLETQDKRRQMFCLWLASQPGASHNQLVEVLRLKVIGEDRMAQEYEERVKEKTKTTEATQIGAAEQSSTSTACAPAWSTSTVMSSMVEKASGVLTHQVYQLQEKYDELLQVIQDLSKNANVGIVKNQLRNVLQERCFNQSHGISFYKKLIDKITTMDEVFAFLIENHFIGYLNYSLLIRFSRKVICGDRYKEAQDEVLEYEKHYCKFIEEPAFYQLIEVFDENPHLNPGTVVGLPIVVISLSQKWKTRNKKDLNEWIPFLKENKHLLQSIGYKCILITYAIFPVHLLKVMRFLSNEEHMKRLKVNGITIETPSYTMEIAERLREASTGELIEEGDELQCQYFLLLKKVKRTEQDQLRIQQEQLRDKAYYIVQIAITKATERVNLYKIKEYYEEKFKNQNETISIQSKAYEDKVQQLLEEIDSLKSEIQMKERLEDRKRTSERVLSTEIRRKVSVKVSSKKLEDSQKSFPSTDSGLSIDSET